jgi:hypothetical protein
LAVSVPETAGLSSAPAARCRRTPRRQPASHETFLEIQEIQNRLIQGYRADFAKHSGKANAAHINRVFDNVPEQITKTVDSSVSRYRFKDVIPGYSKFSQLEGPIDWLIQSGLMMPVYIIDSPAIPLRSRRKKEHVQAISL